MPTPACSVTSRPTTRGRRSSTGIRRRRRRAPKFLRDLNCSASPASRIFRSWPIRCRLHSMSRVVCGCWSFPPTRNTFRALLRRTSCWCWRIPMVTAADTCDVFADGLHVPTGFELGDGGVYVAPSQISSFCRTPTRRPRGCTDVGFRIGTEDSHHAIAHSRGAVAAHFQKARSIIRRSRPARSGPGEERVFRYEPKTGRPGPRVVRLCQSMGTCLDDWTGLRCGRLGGANYLGEHRFGELRPEAPGSTVLRGRSIRPRVGARSCRASISERICRATICDQRDHAGGFASMICPTIFRDQGDVPTGSARIR